MLIFKTPPPVIDVGVPTTLPFLRFYRSDGLIDGRVKVIRDQVEYDGSVEDAVAQVIEMYKADTFFRWFEPLEQQIAGRHW